MKNIWKRINTAVIAGTMLVSSLAISGCSKMQAIDLNNPEITIMVQAFNTYSADENSPVVQELERYLAEQIGVESLKLNLKWAASSNYGEKVTAAMGSDNWPHLMLITERTSTIIQNSSHGSFWDLTDELKATTTDENGEKVYKYPNLAETDDMVNHNISINGRIYGVYRAREVGRAGVTIRKDWVDNLYEKGALSFDSSHLQDMTMDEFEEMLYAFKNNDPDNNPDNETYGMIVAGADYLAGPLENLTVWNGAPNRWGYDEESGQILPAYMFEEYEEMITKMRKWKEDGVINRNMDTFTSADWNNPFLQSQAGVIIDVADRARRVAQNMADMNPDAEVDVFGYVKKDENTEPRALPTTGHSGYFVIPTKAVKTEEERDLLLKVLDHCNDAYALDLMNYGLMGDSYETVKGDDGKSVTTITPEGMHYAVKINPDGTKSAVKTTDKTLIEQYNDLNQFSTGIGKSELTTYYSMPIAEKVNEVYQENKLFKVPNVAEAYVSPTYSRHSTQLDAIMLAATTKYISGAIDFEEWKNQRNIWLEQGGDKIIKEMNEFYQADEAKLSDEALREDNHKNQYEASLLPENQDPVKKERITRWLTDEEIAKYAAEHAEAPTEE